MTDFETWIATGIKNNWCSPPVCYTHDGAPTTAQEDEEFMDGFDPCLHIIRLYEDAGVQREVEKNHSPSVWRKQSWPVVK